MASVGAGLKGVKMLLDQNNGFQDKGCILSPFQDRQPTQEPNLTDSINQPSKFP